MADPTLSTLASGTSTTATTTPTFSAQASGVLLLLSVSADDYRTTSGSNRPESSGWSYVNGGEDYLGHYLWWKLSTGSETSVVYTIGSATRSVYAIAAATNIDASPLGANTGLHTHGGATIPTTAITPTSGSRWLVVASLGCMSSDSTPITGMTSLTNSYTTQVTSVYSGNSGANPSELASIGYLILDGGTGTSTTGDPAGNNGVCNVGVLAAFKVSAGGASLTASGTDAVGVGDSAVTVQGFSRTAADSVGVVDSVDTAQGMNRAATDPVGLTDSASFTAGLTSVATATDPVGATDSIAAAQSFVRSAADAVGVTDSASFQPGFALSFTVTDAVGITDLAAQQSIDSALDQVDPVGLSDSATLDVGRISTDLVGLTDSIAGTQAFARAASDQVGLVDSASFNLAAAGAITGADLVGLTDSLATSQSLVRSVSDPVGIGDSGAFALGAVAGGTDPVGLSDSGSFVLVQAGNVQAADLVALADSLATARDYARVLTDIVGVTDSASFTIGMVISAPDQLGISDTATFAVDHGVMAVTASDSMGVTDSFTLGFDGQRVVSEVISMTDSAVFRIPRDFTVTFGRPVMGGRVRGTLVDLDRAERQYVHWPSWGLVGTVPQIQVGGTWVPMTLDTDFTPPADWVPVGPAGEVEWYRVLLAGPDAAENPSGTLVVAETAKVRRKVVAGDEIDISPDGAGEWVRLTG